jgi:glycosyltransferase involved in cell wall biosynthesis
MTPRCTVLLPVRNGMPFLPAAIDSLLAQSVHDILIYVLDDGSTDGTKEYAASIRDGRVRRIEGPVNGLAAVLNHGLSLVTTEYAARLDADDIAAPHRLQRQMEFLDAHPDHVLVGSPVVYISENGKRKSWTIRVPQDNDAITAGMKKGASVLFHSTILFRTDAVRSAGGYDPAAFPAEDYDLFMRLSAGGKLANVDDVLLEVRITSGSVIATKFRASLQQYHRVVERQTGTKRNMFQRAYHHIDDLSRILYRKGMNAFLNSSRAAGAGLFLLSAAVNPIRAFTFIVRRMKR